MTTKSKADVAVERLLSGMLCSQAVLSAFCDDLGMELPPAMRLASGFGGGIGLMGSTCGAATGGIMVLGLAYGPAGASGDEAKTKIFEPASQFLARFKSIQGTFDCKEIIDGLDLNDPDALASMRNRPELAKKCIACVRGAVEILEDMLKQ